jgi:hypothetical protein
VVNVTPRSLYPRERPGTHCIGSWVGPTAGLDGCGKFCPTGFDPRTVQPVTSRYTGWATPAPTTAIIHLQVLYLMTVEFLKFIMSQFTTNAQNILQLNQRTQAHVWLWTVAPFQKSRGGCGWFYRHKNCVELSLHFHFQLEPNTLWQMCAHKYNIKDWGQHVGLCLENCLLTYIHINVLRAIVWGTNSKVFPVILDTNVSCQLHRRYSVDRLMTGEWWTRKTRKEEDFASFSDY